MTENLLRAIELLPTHNYSDEELKEQLGSLATLLAAELPDAVPFEEIKDKESNSVSLLTLLVVGKVIELPFRLAAVNHITELSSNIPSLLSEMETSLKNAVTREEICEVCNSVSGKANGCLDALSQIWDKFLDNGCKKAAELLPENLQTPANTILEWLKPAKKQVSSKDWIDNLTEITDNTIQEGVKKFKTQLQDALDKQVSNFMIFCLLDSCTTTAQLAGKLYNYYITTPKQIEYIKKEFSKIRNHLVEACLLLESYYSHPMSTETKIKNHLDRAESLIFKVEEIINGKLN
ncbi:predicted protein, partial [Naegleria gruberi]